MATQLLPHVREPAAPALAAPAADRPRRIAEAVRPWRLLALLAGCGFVVSAIHPFRDVDVYWHVLLGREIVGSGSVHGAGSDWSYGLPDVPWTTTQWLAEVALHGLEQLGGWGAISALQVACAFALATGLAFLVLRGRPSPWASLIYLMSLLVLSAALQERPALLSLVLLLWVAHWSHRVLRGGPCPRPWVAFLVTALWANLHGLWILVPAVAGLLAVGALLDGDRREGGRRVRLLALSLIAGCLTPVGWSLLLSPFRFSAATQLINEWQPTRFDNPFALAWGLLLLMVVLAWARADGKVPASEICLVLGVCAFAFLALRNVFPATVLLAPVVASRFTEVFPRVDAAAGRREQRVLVAAAVLVVLALPLVLVWRAASTPLLPDALPVELVRALDEMPGEHRVLNDYDTAGLLLYYGGPGTTVRVDGRADRYGARYIRQHQELLALRGPWRELLAASDTNYALLEKGTPLLGELARRGWSVLLQDDGYVLLGAPPPRL